MIALRRDFHRHPELSFQEQRTAGIIAERQHAAGLEVRTGIAGTGVVGVLRGDAPGRTVAWRAEPTRCPSRRCWRRRSPRAARRHARVRA